MKLAAAHALPYLALLFPLGAAVAPPVAAGAQDQFELGAGDHVVIDLVDQAAVWLGRNYLRNDAELTQVRPIRLQTPLQLDAAELEQALGQFLYARGFAIVTLSEELELYQVVSLTGAQRGEVASRPRKLSPDEVLEHAGYMHQVLTVVPLRNLDAMAAATALRPFLSQTQSFGQVTIGSVADQSSVLVQGFAPQVAAAIRLLRSADEIAGDAADRDRIESLEDRLRELERAQQSRHPGTPPTTTKRVR